MSVLMACSGLGSQLFCRLPARLHCSLCACELLGWPQVNKLSFVPAYSPARASAPHLPPVARFASQIVQWRSEQGIKADGEMRTTQELVRR